MKLNTTCKVTVSVELEFTPEMYSKGTFTHFTDFNKVATDLKDYLQRDLKLALKNADVKIVSEPKLTLIHQIEE